ncbi:MAG: 4-(cytidine 5'-diphospho)-2-C-methyl-D-erythritol kinase [Vicinamibacterales bacterium]
MRKRGRVVRVDAPAKINLTLRVLDRHDDGYHEIRTTFQSIALSDSLFFEEVDGPFSLECADPECPPGPDNLVWRGASLLWTSLKRRGRMRGVQVTLVKRVPSQAGLGGGSSDAAAALRALARIWDADEEPAVLDRVAAKLGADVSFFLRGGTALGLGRGDAIFPLADPPASWVVIARPPFGVPTADAYRWFDESARSPKPGARSLEPDAWSPKPKTWSLKPGAWSLMPGAWSLIIPPSELGNDLQAPVVAKHPQIGGLIRKLARQGAFYAGMSGSGSAVFGLFREAPAARAAAGAVAGRGVTAWVTRTLSRRAAHHAMRLRL